MRIERLEGVTLDAAIAAVGQRPGSHLLESGFRAFGLGRYSIFASDPYKEFVGRGRCVEIRGEGESRLVEGEPFELLREELAKEGQAGESALPFSGGAIGYLGYGAGRVKSNEEGPSQAPDMRFGFYKAAVIWDHDLEECYAATSEARSGAGETLQRLKRRLQAKPGENGFSVGTICSNLGREAYLARVQRVREYIRAGEVYQVNLSQRFRAPFQGSSEALYRRLREVNPAPYSAYLNFGDESMLSSSPERFLHLRGGVVNTRPIKGTRPRGGSDQETEAFRKALAGSEKDRAELLMIVDLERNDLGRVCEAGTVKTKDLFALETYASVIHQTATVEGRLVDGRDAIDCLKAMFPGGSITGAPKIRAMQVIDELEAEPRGIYTGSIGYIGFDGRADFNIAIRTMRVADGELSFNAGGGIVWDSDPDAEYQESMDKAKALFEAAGRTCNDE